MSIPGVYGGLLDKVAVRRRVRQGPDLRMGQTHVHRYLRPLLGHIERGGIDPTFIISHRWPMSRAAEAYRMWNDKSDDCTKFVLDPTR